MIVYRAGEVKWGGWCPMKNWERGADEDVCRPRKLVDSQHIRDTILNGNHI